MTRHQTLKTLEDKVRRIRPPASIYKDYRWVSTVEKERWDRAMEKGWTPVLHDDGMFVVDEIDGELILCERDVEPERFLQIFLNGRKK